jgi:cytosine/adenosine deaminase-related metal-dependent hydrolase
MVQPLHIRGAAIWDGQSTVRRDLFTSERVVAEPPKNAQMVDLDGYTIFPGLINAHDHLELNHYPRSKFRGRYDNAYQWGEDMNARLDTEPYKSLRAYPLADRLLIGGLKNLLCGATTVAHHNPPHKELFRKDFPVRVLRKYGWTHSLHFSTDEEVVRSYQSTPKDVPWFIHLAEGTDDIAAGEYKRLKALGCVRENTVIVHGVGISLEDVYSAHEIFGVSHATGGIRVVWCPSTNYFLLNQTLLERVIAITGRVALGSDSRLTADGDLLDEINVGRQAHIHEFDIWIISLVLENGALLLRQQDIGHLRAQAQTDWILIRTNSGNAAAQLSHSRRADLALVVKGGVPQIGNPDVMAKFPQAQTVPATLDGVPKRIHIGLARRIWKCSLKERGLELDEPPKAQVWFFNRIAQ